MTSILICYFANLFFLIFLSNPLCFNGAFPEQDFIKNETNCERLPKNSTQMLENSLNIIRNKTTKVTRTIDNSFLFPGSSSLNSVSETLDANTQAFIKHTGYISLTHSYGARLFYFFFESRGSKNDPVVLWLNGGWAGSSGLFYDNGPFHIKDDLSLKWNDFGWDTACNFLYVNQQIGIGFSYSTNDHDMRRNSKEVSNDLYDFLQIFFQAHPEFVENDFYIVGSGTNIRMAPLLASRLHQKNMAKEDIHINLKGLTIINGDINPEYTQAAFPDFLYTNRLISTDSYDTLKEVNKEYLSMIKRCQTDDNVCCYAANQINRLFYSVIKILGNPNRYDFRYFYWNFTRDNERVNSFFAQEYVRSALGVENITYEIESNEVFNAMHNDSMKSYDGVIPQLLEDGIKVLILNGEYNLESNWLGNLRWMEAMKWSGHNIFSKTKVTPYKVDGKKVGKVKNTGPLTFLKIFDAGRWIGRDQPYISLQIFKNWMNS